MQLRVAATKLFALRGYAAVSLQDIADSVGVAKQTLLYHYPSKELLRRAVLDGVFDHWRTTLPAMLSAVTSGKRRLSALADELVRFFSKDRDRARILARELLDNPKDTQRLLGESLRPWLLLLAEYIREGKKVGLMRGDVDPECYVLHVILLVVANVANLSTISMTLNADGRAAGEIERRHMKELARLTRSALFVR